MKTPLKLYIPLGGDTELELTCEVRVSNGIESDPQVLRREPTVREMFQAVEIIRGRKFLEEVALAPTVE